jgi:predicted dehydrogenase
MKHSLYPGRYGKWDDAITLCLNQDAPQGEFDLICIGTPPDVHLDLALQALKEAPRALLIEKPLCPPSLQYAQEVFQAAKDSAVQVFVGYDHVVGLATKRVEELWASGAIGEVETIDVEFREHWAGIFAAHPWLKGPADSYLGFWERGGGASGEHSHAMNLWQHFAHVTNMGRVVEISATMKYIKKEGAHYDSLCLVDLRTEQGLVGRVAQDVVTIPSRKWARIQGTAGALEWIAGYSPEGDAVILRRPGKPDDLHLIRKTRPDDFIHELQEVESSVSKQNKLSPIRLERGLDTMLLVTAAHQSEREKCRVRIEYGQGYSPRALASC